MAVKEIKDFSRGYATDLLPDDLPDNMLQTAQNVYFDGKLRKRLGYKTFYTNATASSEIVGHYYCQIGAIWTTIIALEVSNVITFHTNYSGSFTEVDAAFTWAGANQVKMDVVNQRVVMVDTGGVNAPAVLYLDTTLKIVTLDTYDARAILNAFWWAGQYDGTAITYTDDTTDAQDDGAADFNIVSTTDDDGFYVASAKVFSKIVLKTAEQMAGSPVAVYQYYDGDTFQTLTLTTTPNWEAAAGDRTLEFSPPEDWAIWDGVDADDSLGDIIPGSMTGDYVVRVTFSTAPSAATACTSVELSQTKAVTFALFGDIPTDVVVHNSRVFLIVDNSVTFSIYGNATGFEASESEYFALGGKAIRAAKSMDKALYIVKDAAIHKLSGTTPEDFIIEIVANRGTTNGDSVAVVGDYMCFSDGNQLLVFTGTTMVEVASHISSDIPATGVGVSSGGSYWLIASDKILRFNPDSIKNVPWGESAAAIYKYTNASTVKGIVKYIGTNKFGDTSLSDRLVGYISGQPKLICLEYGTQMFDETDTVIPVIVETKMYSFGIQTEKKIYRRVKPLISQSGEWTFTVQTGRDATSLAITIASGTGGTYYTEDISLPYTVDSDTISFKLANSTLVDCVIYAVSVDVELRPY